jgi:hypothetical protein
MATSSTATARRSAWSTAGFAAGCGASCGGDAERNISVNLVRALDEVLSKGALDKRLA